MKLKRGEWNESIAEKKFPVDIQAFEIMWGKNCLYMDKTRHIFQVLQAINSVTNLSFSLDRGVHEWEIFTEKRSRDYAI